MNKIEFLKFLANAPKNLKGYSELLDYARNFYKQVTGVFPEGIDNISIKQAVKEIANQRDPKKVVPFPKGGKDKLDPFKPRSGEFGITVLDDAGKPVKTTRGETPEGIMEFLMKSGKSADTNIGTAPKTTKKKPKVDPELKKAEDQKQLFMDFEGRIETEPEMLARMKKQNKEAIERLKKKKEKDLSDKLKDLPDDIDPDAMADGGRIGFSGGGAGFAGDPMEGDKYVMSDIPGSPQIPMGQFGPVNVGIFGGGGFRKNEIVPGVDMATTDQTFGIMGQIPIGDTGFSIGGDYMKSRVNERFTGDRIPGQVFKNVPVDSDRFNIGINFRKQFKDGSKPKDPSKRSFLKLMGGLAAIPFIGKYFKPAAKIAEKAAPVIEEGTKLGFENFMLLVDKIKRLGKDVTKTSGTKEREKVTRYTTDNNEYELIEDLSTGDVRIVKDRMGGTTIGDETFDTINDRSVLDYRSPKSFYNNQTKKGGETLAEYDEVKEVANRDGTFDDFDEIDDFAVQEMLEEIGKKPIKKAGGGLAYMLGE